MQFGGYVLSLFLSIKIHSSESHGQEKTADATTIKSVTCSNIVKNCITFSTTKSLSYCFYIGTHFFVTSNSKCSLICIQGVIRTFPAHAKGGYQFCV